jgi:Fe-S-cluster containining protein
MEFMTNSHFENKQDIVEVYNKLNIELASINPGCDACGTCCHFDLFDHELYASSIEINHIVNNINLPPFDPNRNICPFLIENKCTIREYRTLGCRVFFCNSNYKDTSQEIYNKYYKLIKDIAIRNQIEWRYAPMVKLLATQRNQSNTNT